MFGNIILCKNSLIKSLHFLFPFGVSEAKIVRMPAMNMRVWIWLANRYVRNVMYKLVE